MNERHHEDSPQDSSRIKRPLPKYMSVDDFFTNSEPSDSFAQAQRLFLLNVYTEGRSFEFYTDSSLLAMGYNQDEINQARERNKDKISPEMRTALAWSELGNRMVGAENLPYLTR